MIWLRPVQQLLLALVDEPAPRDEVVEQHAGAPDVTVARQLPHVVPQTLKLLLVSLLCLKSAVLVVSFISAFGHDLVAVVYRLV